MEKRDFYVLTISRRKKGNFIGFRLRNHNHTHNFLEKVPVVPDFSSLSNFVAG